MGALIIFIVCLISFQIYNATETYVCNSVIGTETCCSGYQWNSAQNKCIPCGKGYKGKECEEHCAPPFYGFDCQSQCNCSNKDCHYANGCEQPHTIEQINGYTTSTYVIMKTTANGNFEKKNGEDNPSCLSIHKSTQTEKTPIVVGIIVLAAVAFIISLTILFTYRIEKRQKFEYCHEQNV